MYTGFAVYICFPFHNVIFFHNHCPIHSTTMSTAYSQHIHIVLFTTTLQCILALLFIYAFLFTMWYFFTITAQFTLQQCLQHIRNIYIQYCVQLLSTVNWLCCIYMLSFSQCDIFPQLPHNSLYKHVYSISSTYTYGICLQLHYPVHWLCYLYMLPLHNVIFFHNYCTIDSTTMSTAYPPHIHIVLFYNYSPMYTGFAVYICFPFHNVIFFHNDCTINSTPMFTAYPQHIHTILFTTTLQCILPLLFIYAFLFTMWYFFTITAQFTLQQCLQHIRNIYIQYCVQLLSTVNWLCCLYMLSFSQCDIFPQWLHN